MIHPVATRPAGATETLFCERCGAVAGEATSLRRVGLTRCTECGVHACQRCWARTAGSCPGCGYSAAGAGIVAALQGDRRAPNRSTQRPRPAAPAALAGPRRQSGSGVRWSAVVVVLAVFVVTGSALALVFTSQPRLEGGVAGIVGTPGPSGGNAAGSLAPGAVPPGPPGGGIAAEATTTPGGDTAGEPGGGGGSTSTTPAPAQPTPRPTRTPHPTPDPTPTPSPSPSPCLAHAPKLIGENRSDAALIWKTAGFSGRVIALAGHGNYVIATQNRKAGVAYPCDSDVTVGP